MTAPRPLSDLERELVEGARELMRKCCPDATDEVVNRQAAKIVKSMLPTVKAARSALARAGADNGEGK